VRMQSDGCSGMDIDALYLEAVKENPNQLFLVIFWGENDFSQQNGVLCWINTQFVGKEMNRKLFNN
jgi:hypothetical protein